MLFNTNQLFLSTKLHYNWVLGHSSGNQSGTSIMSDKKDLSLNDITRMLDDMDRKHEETVESVIVIQLWGLDFNIPVLN